MLKASLILYSFIPIKSSSSKVPLSTSSPKNCSGSIVSSIIYKGQSVHEVSFTRSIISTPFILTFIMNRLVVAIIVVIIVRDHPYVFRIPAIGHAIVVDFHTNVVEFHTTVVEFHANVILIKVCLYY